MGKGVVGMIYLGQQKGESWVRFYILISKVWMASLIQ